MKPSRVLRLSLGGSVYIYLLAIVSVGLASVGGYASPLIVRFAVDSVLGGESAFLPAAIAGWLSRLGGPVALREGLWIVAAAIITITMLTGVFSFLQGRLAAVAAEDMALRLRERLYDHLQHARYEYHVGAETGDLVQRCTSDVETVRRFIAIQFVEIGRAVFMAAVALPVLFTMHAPLARVSVVVIPFVFVFAFVFFRRVQTAFRAADEAEGALSTVLQENLTGMRVVRAFGRQRFEADKFDVRNRAYRDLVYRLIRLLAWYWSTSDFLSITQIGAIVVVGTHQAVAGEITIGILLTFVTVETMLLFPIRQMGRILADMGRTSVALRRIGEVLELPRETDDSTRGDRRRSKSLRPEIKGAIEFADVSFAYAERPILKKVSFQVAPGQTVAILGPTGSGKSTLLSLISRLYDYDSGSIRVDGVELVDIERAWIRSHVGFVLQEPFLFAKTIRENIRLADRNAPDSAVYSAAQTAAVHDVIERFDSGYDTPVGERGVTLSGGQKQRVAIARALIRRPPILVFDDSLSAVDTETDARIRAALTEARRSATTFIISHRITTLSEADMILVVNDGQLVQSGTHDELVAEEGMYRRLWDIQRARETDAGLEHAQ
ncbi:MAG: ABC transporter ATP-binding protein [Spirochaetales bacterium]